MKNRNYALPAARLMLLNDCIAGLYRAAREKNALQAVIDTMLALIPGELHLAFTTRSNGEVSFATSNGSQGDQFIMATMSAAESHPLIYQTDRQVSAISDVLSTSEWQRRDMYHLASPFLKMADALGTDMRIAKDTTFSTCVIREGRNFRDNDRSGLDLMIPHFFNILEMNGRTDHGSDYFHILPLQSLPTSIQALNRVLRSLLDICPAVSKDLGNWILYHRAKRSLCPQSRTFFSTASSCSAVLVPSGLQCEGAVAVRSRPVVKTFSSAHPMLTRRENEIGHWLCAGKTNAEIATILDIAPGTVKRHLENIYEKLGAPNRVATVRLIQESMDCS